LKQRGIDLVVVGGSAITSWTPTVYTSYDVDFVAINGATRKHIASALHDIGFMQRGRIFAHADCRYTVDFVATTPLVDRRIITEFAAISTRFGEVRVLKPEDAVADRVAAWVHWSDSQSLTVAEESARLLRDKIHAETFDKALESLQPGDAPSALRLRRARERLTAILTAIGE
jgi:hypothetical protein